MKGTLEEIGGRQVRGALVRVVQSGVFVWLEHPYTVRAFLEECFNLSESFILSRVQTILLDSKVVDDMDTAWLRPGSRLALSAAMPGVVGAALRRDGLFARMREGIRCPAGCCPDDAAPFWMELRLYNAMIEELARPLLAYGFLIREDRMEPALSAFLQEPPSALPTGSFLFVRTPSF